MEQGGTLYRIPNYSIEKNNMNCQAMLSLYALSAYLLFDDKLEYIVMLLSNTVYCPTHYLISGLRETGLSFEGLYMGMPFHPQVYCKVYAPVIFNYLVESLLCARQRANVLVKATFECKGGILLKSAQKEQGERWRGLCTVKDRKQKALGLPGTTGPGQSHTGVGRGAPSSLPGWLCLFFLSTGFLCLLLILLNSSVVSVMF